MTKKYFECDYMEGAYPAIMNRLMETNMEKTTGYGFDPYCVSAREKIANICGCPGAPVHFLVGGTQTNSLVLTTILRPFEGVVAVDTAHINLHEAGAIEGRGHKVIALPGKDGKLQATDVEQYAANFYADDCYAHMVRPGAIYISHPTELGTLYTKKELEDLRRVCDKYHMRFYLDGARLGYGLMANNTDVTLKTIAANCDVFYIGGTKVGALFGEALVFPNASLADDIFTMIKHEGALLAKGRLLGIQFDTLFTDDLYFKISKHAIDMAELLKKGLKDIGCRIAYESPTNQQYIIVEDANMEKISEKVAYSFWERYDETHTVIRLVTSWATKEEDVLAAIDLLKEYV